MLLIFHFVHCLNKLWQGCVDELCMGLGTRVVLNDAVGEFGRELVDFRPVVTVGTAGEYDV